MRYTLVDRFLELEVGKRARSVKCVTKGEPFLAELDAFPSALVLEAMFQTAGTLTRAGIGFTRMSVLGKVDKAEFPAEARPGDRIDLQIDILLTREEGTLCEGVAKVGDTVVGRAEFMIVFVPADQEPAPDAARERRRQNMMKALRIPSEAT